MRECKYCLTALAIFLIAGISIMSYGQQSRTELESKRESLLKEIETTARKIEEARTTKQKASDRIEDIEKQIDNRNKLMANLCESIDQMDNKMIQANSNAAVLQKELDRLKIDYTQVMQAAYRRHLNYSDYLMFLSSKSINAFFSWWLYVRQFDSFTKVKVNTIMNDHKSLMDNIYNLETNKKKKMGLVKEQERQQASLSAEIETKNKLLESLNQKEAELVKKVNDKEKEKKKLDDKIEKIILAEIKAAEAKKAKAAITKSKTSKTKTTAKAETSSAKLKDTPNDDPISSSFAANKGKFSWPVDKASVISGSGKQEYHNLKGVYTNNKGITIKTGDKAVVKSIFEGTVVETFSTPTFRNIILISHGKYFTLFKNMEKVTVKKGDKIKAKQIIGNAGYDNTYECPLIIFEIWNGKNPLSPESWLHPM
ncbi:MAG TPA: peptidoglycan DD-metalloendopeptidase family protein [Saprospiraceae bacterium]|nr:peptidoglycan DD-metalloendopeptidase family protein [Saprospiraceae bacterium]